MTRRIPRVLFLGVSYAGQRTRFENLIEHASSDPRIAPEFRWVTGWAGGRIERLPFLTDGIKGRLRAVAQARAIATLPRPDVIWTSVAEVAAPHLWSQLGPLRRPMVLDLDGTVEQIEAMAPEYFGRQPRRGMRLRLATLVQRAVWSRTTFFAPWSTWAAEGLRQRDIDDSRIRIVPPGVDLGKWHPVDRGRAENHRLRLLFVGGDWKRKGGDTLLEVFRTAFADRCTLDVVTRDPVPAVAGVTVHRLEANSSELRELYRRADLFVLPTRAECFGIASVEAMASGLPVIMGDVGAARDIVDHGETGWLVRPRGHDLRAAMEQAVARPEALTAMGRRARRKAELRFDGHANDRRVVDLLVEAAGPASRYGLGFAPGRGAM